ncbi:nicotinate-nucleotide--dimethylbenzimidazole phosphoribosyltransferase [Mesorhizobium sp. M0767]|uniref:nicotinate-nucleotide--dimethylbenzimidazole phosphoribosyltransferase n=1 Tax=Mesorhizobium sp. M0767 TaxID=2956995 RepID=UPI0033390D17
MGGARFAAIAGTIIAARTQVAAVLEGFPATAAAAVLYRANPAALDHCPLA